MIMILLSLLSAQKLHSILLFMLNQKIFEIKTFFDSKLFKQNLHNSRCMWHQKNKSFFQFPNIKAFVDFFKIFISNFEPKVGCWGKIISSAQQKKQFPWKLKKHIFSKILQVDLKKTKLYEVNFSLTENFITDFYRLQDLFNFS